MLTSEQTTIRLRDAEITRLRLENERLRSKLKTTASALCDLLRFVAETYVVEFSNKAKLLSMIKGLEEDVQ